MEDWHIFGENAGWDFSSSEASDDDEMPPDGENRPSEGLHSYQNLHSIPEEHSTDKKLIGYCSDGQGNVKTRFFFFYH